LGVINKAKKAQEYADEDGVFFCFRYWFHFWLK
jgi:hypothetical protein